MLNRIKKRIMNYPIRTQLIIFFVSVLSIVVIAFLILVQRQHSFLKKTDSFLTYFSHINELYYIQRENSELITNCIKEISEENINLFNKNIDNTFKLIDIIKEESITDETKLLVRAIENVTEVFDRTCKDIIKTKIENKSIQVYEYDNDYYYKYLETIKMQEYISGYSQKLLNISLREKREYIKFTLDKNRKVQRIIIIFVLGITLASIGFYLMFANYITTPIYRLLINAKQIGKGNLEVKKLDIEGPIEVMELMDTFNNMSLDIKMLIENLKDKAELESQLAEEEIERVKMGQLLKEARLAGLQMQINPHFLFNTLNAISRMAMFEEAQKAYDLIIALSKFLRYSLNPNRDITTLEQEVDMISQYLYILKCRMGERLEINIQCKARSKDIHVPLFILQPLVENAYRHGLEDKEENGFIFVNIKERNNYLILQVYDNGVGMSKEILQDIRKKTKFVDVDFSQESHIGIRNVCSRLNLTFNQDVKYSIYSSFQKGTIFTILINLQK